MQKITSGILIRTLCLLLALVNQVLTSLGRSPLPIEDETITLLVSTGATAVTAITAWWKNNSFTKAALEADKVLAAGEEELDADNEEGLNADSESIDADK